MSLREGKDNLNFGERSDHAQKRGKNTDRWRLIIVNIAIGLVIVIIALSVKAIVLDKKADEKQTKDHREMAAATVAPSATSAAVATPEPQGADRWLRKADGCPDF